MVFLSYQRTPSLLKDFALHAAPQNPEYLVARHLPAAAGRDEAGVGRGAQHRLVYLVGEVRRQRTAHVCLHAVGERVERAAYYLRHRQRLRQVAVKHGEGMIGAEQRLLQLLLLVGDNGAVVLLRARARCRDYGSHRPEVCRLSVVGVPCVPHVLIHPRQCRHNLAAVDDRPAAHGEYEVDVVLADNPRAFLHLGVRRVGHYAAAVGQEYARAHVLHLSAYRLLGASLAEIQADGIVVIKCIHCPCMFVLDAKLSCLRRKTLIQITD